MDEQDVLTRHLSEAREELRFAVARRSMDDLVQAEDVVQDAWLRLHERAEPADWREPRAVIFTTAIRLAINTSRRAKRWARIVVADPATCAAAASTEPGPEQQLEAEETLAILGGVLDGLPSACREAFLLNRLEGLTHGQIADRLGVSTETVQRHIERTLQHCVAALAAREFR